MPLCQWSWGLAGLPSAQNNWTTPCGAGIIEFNGIVWSIQTAFVLKTRRHIIVIIQERVYAIRAHVQCSYLCFILVPYDIYDIYIWYDIYIIYINIYTYNIYIYEILWSPASWDVPVGHPAPTTPRQTIAGFTMRKPSRMWLHQWPRCRGAREQVIFASLCFVYVSIWYCMILYNSMWMYDNSIWCKYVYDIVWSVVL